MILEILNAETRFNPTSTFHSPGHHSRRSRWHISRHSVLSTQYSGLNTQLSVAGTWFRYFLLFDPAPILAKVRIPVLAIVGEKDLQVPPKENLVLIEAASKKGGNKKYTVLLMPGLNHLFQTTKTGSPVEYGAIEETDSPTALQTTSDWILKQTTPRKRANKRRGRD